MYGEHCPEGERTIYSTQEVGGPCLLDSLHCPNPMAAGLHLWASAGPAASLVPSLPLQTHPTLRPVQAPQLPRANRSSLPRWTTRCVAQGFVLRLRAWPVPSWCLWAGRAAWPCEFETFNISK